MSKMETIPKVCPVKAEIARVMADRRERTIGDIVTVTGLARAEIVAAVNSLIWMDLLESERVNSNTIYRTAVAPGTPPEPITIRCDEDTWLKYASITGAGIKRHFTVPGAKFNVQQARERKDAIRDSLRKTGPSTRADICREFRGLPPSTISCYLSQMRREGMIAPTGPSNRPLWVVL